VEARGVAVALSMAVAGRRGGDGEAAWRKTKQGGEGLVGLFSQLGRNLTGPAGVEQTELTRELGPDSVQADRKMEKWFSIPLLQIWIWIKVLHPNQRYFQIQTKFKPSPKIEFWYFWNKIIVKLKSKFKSQRF
jgi:hypothetical protein